MNTNPTLVRRALLLALVAVLAGSTGCGWFRGKSGYENSPESRPLEVPPDLDRPAADGTMEIPAAAGAPRAAPSGPVSNPVTGASFVIADSAESAWRRLGLALERIEGVSIGDRDPSAAAYNVGYEGETFQVRIAAEGEGSRISAVSQDGQEMSAGAAGKLLALLKQRLG
jgi:uncharacterized lipoprotein